MRARAFTLIELLVVIAIIAILAAILFPVFSKAKESAKAAQGMAQMRQLSLTVMLYTADSDGAFVPSTNYDAPLDSPSRIWTTMVQPYAKNKGIFVSPGSSGAAYAEGWATRHNQSVGMNDALAFSTLIGNTADRICSSGEVRFGCSAFSSAANENQMEDTSRVGLIADTPNGPSTGRHRGFVFGADNGTIYRPDYTAFTSLDQAVPLAGAEDLVATLGAPPQNLGANELKPIIGRYTGRTPVVFADGHAKSYLATAIASGASGILWRFR
jgi:prepilin-type N-terminal cleavage/methylation domain-containing protein/prepilin-type processing-associated H-X9-DG protein